VFAVASMDDDSIRPIVAYDPHDCKVPRAVRQRFLDRLVEKNVALAALHRPPGAVLDVEERTWAAAAAQGEEEDLYQACEGKMAYVNLAQQYLKRCRRASQPTGAVVDDASDAQGGDVRNGGATRDAATVEAEAMPHASAAETDPGRAATAPKDETTCLASQESFWRPFLVSEARCGHLRENIWSWDGHARDKRKNGTCATAANTLAADARATNVDDVHASEAEVSARAAPTDVSTPGNAAASRHDDVVVAHDPSSVYVEELDRFLATKLEAFVSSGRLSQDASERIAQRARAKVLRAEARTSGPLRSQAKERIYDLLVRYVERETS